MANRIEFFRLKHGLTQKELAEKVNVHVHALSYAERTKVGVELAQRIADVLNENVFDVLGADAFRLVPQTQEDKDIVIELISGLR